MNIAGVIPARYGSSRFPGKCIAPLQGKPIIWHVYNRASKFDFSSLHVAIDDERVAKECDKYNIPWVMTKTSHVDCLDRAHEFSTKIAADKYIIIQGDEPFFDTSILKGVDFSISPITCFCAEISLEEAQNPNVVKVALNECQKGIYFSRSVIPCGYSATTRGNVNITYYKQLGVYSMSRKMLDVYSQLGPSYLESCEGVGVLRFVDIGIDIDMEIVDSDSFGVDTPEDLIEAEKRLCQLESE